MLNGLYKVEYGVNDAFGRSIMCMHNGRLLGGNSAFAHLGTYQEVGGEILGEVITRRHNDDPYYKPLMDTDVAAISVRGSLLGNRIRFEGSAAPRPGALFWANLTRLDDEALPPVGTVGQAGIVNGLYSIHLRALDGIKASLSGVMLLMDGRILGGDAFFYYLGSYSSAMAAGKARSSIRSTRRRRAKIPCSAATRLASDFPAPATRQARSSKPLRWPESAACDWPPR